MSDLTLLDQWGDVEDMLKEILDMDSKEGANSVRRAAREAMQPVLEDAIADAPQDTGNLKENIKMTAKLGRKKSDKSAVTVQVGTTRKAKYAIHQEYGTSEIEAQPFLRPALQKNEEKVVDGLKGSLSRNLEKSIKKVQRRKARLAKKENS